MHKLALLALLVGGCSKSDSGDILTSGMYASISARAEGDGKTRVITSLYLGKPIDLNFIELTDGDKLVVRHASQEMIPTEGDLLNIVSYTATFSTDAEGEMFEVSFERTVDAGAPSSVATLPAPFTLTAPPATSSRAAAMTLTWSPLGSGNLMHAVIDGSCIDLLDVPITGDTGTVTIPAGMIPAAGSDDSRLVYGGVPDRAIEAGHARQPLRQGWTGDGRPGPQGHVHLQSVSAPLKRRPARARMSLTGAATGRRRYDDSSSSASFFVS